MKKKQFTAVMKANEAKRQVSVIVSTGGIDRDRDTIDPKGWDLSAYKRNPVVLWCHDYQALPLARSLDIGVQDVGLVSTCEFPAPEVSPFSDTVFKLVQAGMINAVSVGFAPKTYELNSETGGIDFKTQELLEYSFCPVPANPEALIARGFDVAKLKAMRIVTDLEEIIDIDDFDGVDSDDSLEIEGLDDKEITELVKDSIKDSIKQVFGSKETLLVRRERRNQEREAAIETEKLVQQITANLFKSKTSCPIGFGGKQFINFNGKRIEIF